MALRACATVPTGSPAASTSSRYSTTLTATMLPFQAPRYTCRVARSGGAGPRSAVQWSAVRCDEVRCGAVRLCEQARAARLRAQRRMGSQRRCWAPPAVGNQGGAPTATVPPPACAPRASACPPHSHPACPARLTRPYAPRPMSGPSLTSVKALGMACLSPASCCWRCSSSMKALPPMLGAVSTLSMLLSPPLRKPLSVPPPSPPLACPGDPTRAPAGLDSSRPGGVALPEAGLRSRRMAK